MTPLEELQAAHKRLSEQRDASLRHAVGRWSNEDDDEPMMRKEIVGSHGAVGVMYDSEHADLIVTLHRTIDAQLAVLCAAISATEAWLDPDGPFGYEEQDGIYPTGKTAEAALALARAINRGA